jgi:Na+/H+ antiporter NhaD/arsenite permease-like protein
VNLNQAGALFFGLAILHTFFVSRLRHWAHHFPRDTFPHFTLRFLAEVEVVFGMWACFFYCYFALTEGLQSVINYHSSLKFTEPIFVFAIMVMASTRPLSALARQLMAWVSLGIRSWFKTGAAQTDLFVVLMLGPLMGSLITEPAAMTVTALLLGTMIERFSKRFIYSLTGVLFVNISIGGALTPFSAPPVLMVAHTWGWDFSYTFQHLGWKSALAVLINAWLFVVIFKKEIGTGIYSLQEVQVRTPKNNSKIPWGITVMHLIFLTALIYAAHDAAIFLPIFLLFLGLVSATDAHQDPLRFKDSLLVAFFLAGIVVFGPLQKWWLEPLLSSLGHGPLFFGVTGLTAITDNAALTYLGSQVQGLSELSKYALVAGAIAGGGLTVIANAPNPAGYSLLADKFPDRSIDPLTLFVAALVPTLVAVACLWYLPY